MSSDSLWVLHLEILGVTHFGHTQISPGQDGMLSPWNHQPHTPQSHQQQNNRAPILPSSDLMLLLSLRRGQLLKESRTAFPFNGTNNTYTSGEYLEIKDAENTNDVSSANQRYSFKFYHLSTQQLMTVFLYYYHSSAVLCRDFLD